MSVNNKAVSHEFVDNGPEFDGCTERELREMREAAQKAEDLQEAWDAYEGDLDDGRPEQVTVRFTHRDGKVQGRVIKEDPRRKQVRTKIVFPTRHGWKGPAPRDGEEITAEVERDTKEGDPHRGTLIVQRLLPTVDARRGGHHLPCSKCGTWTIPKRSPPPRGTRPGEMYFSHGLKQATCETCGLLHEILWPA